MINQADRLNRRQTSGSKLSGTTALNSTMTNARFVAISAVLAAVVLLPVSFTFYQELEALSHGLRVMLTALVIVTMVSTGWLMRHPVRQIRAVNYWLLGGALLLGLVLCKPSQVEVHSADLAQVHYSDGKQVAEVRPAVLSAWGRDVTGYRMHPAYQGGVVVDSLVATFLPRPKEVKVLFAKPQDALFLADGQPTGSDGISVELRAFDAAGNLGYSEKFVISQEKFLKDRWIEKSVQVDAGITSVDVSLGWGGPGSSPNWDSTLVGLQYSSWHVDVGAIGRWMLVCLGAFVLALFLAVNFRLLATSPIVRRSAAPIALVYCSLVLVCLVLLVYLIHSKTSYVYFWDQRNYWEKTETLYALLKDGAWRRVLEVFSSSYTSDYSVLPSVGPALLSLVTGSPTRLNFALSITALYALPAYVSVAYLAKRMADGDAAAAEVPARGGWIFAGLPVLFGLPVYFGTTLNLMPDIGGVVLFIGALLNASALVGAIKEPSGQTQRWQVSTALFRASISLGVLFSLMFIFRRWYLFAAAGMALSVFALVLIEIARARASRGEMLSRAAAAAVLLAFSALPLLCWFLFAWSHDFAQHDYSKLYVAYQRPVGQDIEVFRQLFGIVVPLLCLLGGAALYYFGKGRRLFFLLTVSTAIAALLFHGVQSPGRHHYFLLMPLLGSFLAGVSLLAARRFGVMTSVCLALLLIMGGALATQPLSEKYGIRVFASFDDWQPRQQKYADGFAQLSRWLAAPENTGRKFCLIASSEAINQGIFDELWQIRPDVAKHAYDEKMIHLGQVDGVDGPPSAGIKECQVFLVGVPFQTHLPPGQQFTLEIIQKDMVGGTGIGLAAEREPTVFAMGDGIEIRAYQTRKITDEEYDNLVRRFKNVKAGAND